MGEGEEGLFSDYTSELLSSQIFHAVMVKYGLLPMLMDHVLGEFNEICGDKSQMKTELS